ncbi:hypothetical protein [Pseudonocardia sp. 73-21]|uniref:hypothetical protein n=1 Tax=Pseudonocardia sp. 73-21 TaxID=1895809 RepID=UPI00096805B3|nr:hypothetical protein [Pseudonocardia sp. 73-21]OJY49990.1 MAG: hypothetical protein BGP03_24155 [Pseudonocardia sp. 73-21]
MKRTVAGAALLAVVLGGCSAPSPSPAPAPTPTSAAAPTSAAPTSDDQLCGRSAELATNIRNAAHILDIGPVLPAAIPLLFLASRQMAAQGGIISPALGQASTELVAAIDDLDAQSKAGSTAAEPTMEKPIQYDTKRLMVATAGFERACASR